MIRTCALSVVSLVSGSLCGASLALAAPASPPTAAPPPGLFGAGVDGGFRLEPRPVIDDVFGDSNDYRKIIDRFMVLGDNMQKTRDDFARAVQVALAQIATPAFPVSGHERRG